MASISDWTTSVSGRKHSPARDAFAKWMPSCVLPVLALAALALVAWSSLTFDIPVQMFTRDMANLARVHPLVSVISSLGAFLTCATASVCLFAYAVARAQERQGVAGHLLAVGLFSLYLTADDFYEFHERLLPRYAGIPEFVVYVAIASAAAALLFAWRGRFLKFRPWLLLAALVCLALSIATDAVDTTLQATMGVWQYFLEDSFKFVGLSLWATYFIAMAARTLSMADTVSLAATPARA
jgi:hypothetical protein